MEVPTQLKPDYLFEVSWEVCNKVGGIYTVIATKAKTLGAQFGDQYILIGPDIAKGGNNSEFIEDTLLFKLWRERAINEGLKVRIGRWNIIGNPIAILVDFTSFFTQKNDIFTDLWIKYQLDSLSGGWDYIEPALFGYAAAKVIECFYRHHLNNNHKIVAQFHEWMTGAGILYLEDSVPQVATVFTTHATVLGRAIAGSGVSFYSLFDSFVPERSVNDFNVVSKNSLERIAAKTADCFTTVSDITARECEKFLNRKPDVITHNGFDTSILPNEHSFEKNRSLARKKIFQVAEGLFNQQLPPDSLLIIKSGRYEYRNKGLDIFIDSLAELNQSYKINKTVLGIIFVPAHQTGPRKELLARIENPDFNNPKTHEVLTHCLQGEENDPIIIEIEKVRLNESVNAKVKIIFVPTYLDGNDGIFNMHYYDLLIGFDLAIFPSYYEPWGYTPLESIAHHIPSVTTNVSGFGTMISEQFGTSRPGISIITRTDGNEKDVVAEVAKIISDFTEKSGKEILDAKTDAYNISLSFLWEKLIAQYETAYDIAIRKSLNREYLFHNKPQVEPLAITQTIHISKPIWRNISVEAIFPKELSALQKLAKNLWWSWNWEAEALFEYIDSALWMQCGRNPVLMNRMLSFTKIEALKVDNTFIDLLQTVENKFDKYISVPVIAKPYVAYFCMEYGLCSFIKLYSGGLGILAGDYLKQASDEGLNICGIGLLYKNGYFKQNFSVHGEQLSLPDVQDFTRLPIELVKNDKGAPVTINLFLPGRTVAVQIWKMNIGRVPLYLLDTDLAQNAAEDRGITSGLYQGDQEMRLKQELLLGLGGIRALKALGIEYDICHCNEGHASFINMERIYNLIKEESFSFEQALEIVRASTLFTTHTSVPAANDMFSEELLRKYLAEKAHFFNINWKEFVGLGRIDPHNDSELFSMTYLGAKLSQEINAVSKIHQKVSGGLFNPLWRDFKPAELHIGSVTNGVHYATWAAKPWQEFWGSIGILQPANISTKEFAEKVKDLPANRIWEIRIELKKALAKALKNQQASTIFLQNDAKIKLNVLDGIDENTLVIGFARRFVAYKRSALLFTDPERLSKIISIADKPVLFIFSGKAHPADTESLYLINNLVKTSLNAQYNHAVIFLEDYNMDVAKLLVQGVDLWLNTPDRHKEASGTSGIKAALNGVLNFSVLDGWWAEAYNGFNGWKLDENAIYNDYELQNEFDAEIIYNTLEKEIIPLFFDRNNAQIPVKWVEKIKASLISIVPYFTMQRVMMEYNNNYYLKLCDRVNRLKANNFSIAKSIAAWKKKVLLNWDEVHVVSITFPEKDNFKGVLGEEIQIKIVLDIGKLSIDDIGVEIIISGDTLKEGYFTKEFSVAETNECKVTYECILKMERTGNFDFAFRVFPKNENLPHRQDFAFVKWI